MKKGNQKGVPPLPAPIPGAEGTYIQWLIAEPEGARHFYMRRAIIEEGTRVPNHSHPEDHEIFVLGGEGRVECDGRTETMRPGDFIFIPGGRTHRYENTGPGELTFICCINKVGE